MTAVTLQRLETSSQGTFGQFKLPDGTTFHTAELPWRDNATGVSCVPPGTYSVTFVFSPHFGKNVYQLQGVPGRSDVEIHPGNFAGDVSKGWSSDVEGCILPGQSVGQLPNHSSTMQHPILQQAVLNSGVAVTEFVNKLNSQPFTLTILDIPK